jgi:hypothetical protein
MRQWVISIIIIVFISSCQKQVAYLTVEDKIADKEWFLERYVAPGVNIIYKGKKYPILSKKIHYNEKNTRDCFITWSCCFLD